MTQYVFDRSYRIIKEIEKLRNVRNVIDKCREGDVFSIEIKITEFGSNVINVEVSGDVTEIIVNRLKETISHKIKCLEIEFDEL